MEDMEERAPLKPLLERDDLPPLSRNYLRLSSFLGDEPPPRAISGFLRNKLTGQLIPAPPSHGPSLKLMELLVRLKNTELRGLTRETSRLNVALASGLGGMMLKELYIRTEGLEFPFNLAKGVASATGNLQLNIEEALSGAVKSPLVDTILRESGELIYSRRGGTPPERPKKQLKGYY